VIDFLAQPGSSGAFGALLDEYARAAADFCRVTEGFDDARFAEERPSDDPDTKSALALCRHVGSAAFGYANHLRQAQGLPLARPTPAPKERIRAPADLRPVLVDALRLTEETVAPLRALAGDAVLEFAIPVRWSPQPYNPEVMLEHAICHLLRHRRQLERW